MTKLPNAEAKIYIAQGERAIGFRPDHVITSILGSCVAVCLWDQSRGIGGMNHILLPSSTGQALGAGAFAMETLINDLLKAGVEKQALQAKVFGGAAIVNGLSDIGARNAAFVLDYLAAEGIALVAHSTGGQAARQVKFWPATGQVKQRFVRASEVETVPVAQKMSGNDIELL